jgi:pyruvate-ferredoxin/flavodoxin oxidoreductase
MAKEKTFLTLEGNQATSYIAYMFSEVAAIYPITPSSDMAEYVDAWSANGKKNIFGNTVMVSEMQSEGGAAGAVHGSLQAGALTSTFTASQGLLLMIPNMYKISGELLPGVFHVSARSLAAQALSIFGDHSDVMSVRQSGFAMLATCSAQEIMDIAGIAHLAAIETRVPFLHFFDGFRTSHEIQKVEAMDMEDMKSLMNWEKLQQFRDNALNPVTPVTRGTAQNPDIYFQAREAANPFYDAIPDVVEEYMQKITKITGREYHPFTYYGAPDAEYVTIAMGSVNDTIKEYIDYENEKGNNKYGLVVVHLYRPFSAKYFFNVIPSTVKRIAVLDRTKEPGANGEPLYLDVRDLYYGKENAPMIIGGRYGLSSKDTTPAMIQSVYENLVSENPMNNFTVGIVDDVTNKSLPMLPEINTAKEGTFEAKFFGLGADGTVGANKNSIKIIGENTDKYAQAYFAYDSKKSGGFTTSHLRFGDSPINAHYLVGNPDFVAVHVPNYVDKYDVLKGLKKGGTFLYNSIWSVEDTKDRLPNNVKRYLAENDIKMYMINATKIAEEIGLGNRTNTIMQSAFFKVAEVIPYAEAVDHMKGAIKKSYGTKGENIVKMNYDAVDRGGDVIAVEIPAEWATLDITPEKDERNIPDFIKNVVEPINAQKGDSLPVSTFLGREDGSFPNGTSQYEKRGIGVNVPEWISENCIQCNQCAYVCPHACIRPFLLTEDEANNVPEGTKTLDAKGKGITDYKFRIQVSTLDCTGCSVCAEVCPSKEKSLVMKPLETQLDEVDRWNYMHETVGYKEDVVDKFKSVKNSQFAQPLFEFSGACAGCGETAYIKAATQLFGERMMIANATGCSSIYGASAPATPYCTHQESGQGPAWANSLFEDNAEFGYGMALGVEKLRDSIKLKMEEAMQNGIAAETKEAMQEWIDNMNVALDSEKASEKLVAVLKNDDSQIAKDILALEQYLVKKSVWIVGGDGWAYDIGYGGLDHVIASGQDVNILVLDTEVYSNTGGQASKATPVGAVAKFAASGMKTRKKSLAAMAMTYGYVYVAQVSMGASQTQVFKALKEAEAYPGPSVVIAYSPCIAHGLRAGMGSANKEGGDAVTSGYWQLFRYNPELELQGKNPFVMDSKEPNWEDFQKFLDNEVRYVSLKKSFPEEASRLAEIAIDDAKWRYHQFAQMAKMEPMKKD